MKKGFSLIEVMVVVVIIGILAAVAVPKLFGVAAKSKAAELGPAAGTYIKLQDAFIQENDSLIGNWKRIGYIMPSTANFNYFEGTTNVGDKGYSENHQPKKLSEGLDFAWVAGNKAALNDCKPDEYWGQWRLSIKQGSSGLAAYSVDIPDSECESLTPSFKNLATK